MNDRLWLDNFPRDIHLKNGQVDVWCVSLDLYKAHLNSFQKILSEDEIKKAERMRVDKPRMYYIAARGLLRLIIAEYLDEKPERVKFQYGPLGKPFLAEKFSCTGITFSMSHSHGIALFCITLKRAIGADIEKIRTDLSCLKIAKRFFSSREYDKLLRLPTDQQPLGFFKYWTRKEAYLKAKGEGLFSPLTRFDVSSLPGEPAAFVENWLDPQETSKWNIVDLDVGPNHAAAFAVEGPGFTQSKRRL